MMIETESLEMILGNSAKFLWLVLALPEKLNFL